MKIDETIEMLRIVNSQKEVVNIPYQLHKYIREISNQITLETMIEFLEKCNNAEKYEIIKGVK